MCKISTVLLLKESSVSEAGTVSDCPVHATSFLGFPEKTTVKQRYRLLGNSLNVHVVSKLLTVLCE